MKDPKNTIDLVPLNPDEFAAWRLSTLQGYAEQIMAEGKSEREAKVQVGRSEVGAKAQRVATNGKRKGETKGTEAP